VLGHRIDRKSWAVHLPTRGVDRRRPRHGDLAGPTSSRWRASSSTRPAWSGRCRWPRASRHRRRPGDVGCCSKTPRVGASCSTTCPMFRAETAETEEGGRPLVRRPHRQRRTPYLLPRDEVARGSHRGESRDGAPPRRVYLDIASRRPRYNPTTAAVDVPPVSWSWPGSTSPPPHGRWARRVIT